jgi:methionyl-tRNA formyltransferase
MLKLVFMGSPDFAIPSLVALHNSSHHILAVVTNPDKRRGRGGAKSPSVVKKKANELGYPVIETDSAKDPSFIEKIRELKPDLLVVVAFKILPPQLLAIPRKGSINLHASLLPKYRGAAPIHWAIINGDKETGCTVFFLDEKVDTGEIIKQTSTEIGPDETTGDLYNRLKKIGAKLLVESVDMISSGNVNKIPQKEVNASPAPKLYSEDGRIDFKLTSVNVHNKIRGLNPFPGAWAMYNGKKLNIHRSSTGPELSLEPGELKFTDGQLLAGCSGGTVELVEVQMPGKKKVSGTDFANGYDLNIKLH